MANGMAMRDEDEDAHWHRARPGLLRRLERAADRTARLVFWGTLTFLLNLAEQVAELLAPLAFLLGLLWWGVLRVVGRLDLEPQVQAIVAQLPRTLEVGGWVLSPERLMRDGLMLMVVVAACRTLTAIIHKET
ncbi:hypothetical protein M0638_12250 [Roseomonas sp. NAR14]|uniref:Uncharacterized protein n=1 Tax=Roseomonas acroporae TaxID=2937791 RepID=A0A9X1Y8R8_9PROT|nr:hypothetical protein [Roseomonas acroporae]MCK8785155.1 hypothetical protein [Roseomonas acroporae]